MRGLALYRSGGRRRATETQLPDEPAPEGGLHRLHGPAALLVAVALPAATCLALVPLREHADRSTTALVLVLPVVAVALLCGPVPAGAAAAAGALAFDVLLTRPYQRLEIHAAEDVEATVILLAVGVAVGQLVARSRSDRTKAMARVRELDALREVVSLASRARTEDELVEGSAAVLTDLLGLRGCRWAPGYHGSAGPVLSRTGEIVDDRRPSRDLARLPSRGAELPVTHGGREVGRMVLVPGRRRPVSREERLTAVAIGDLVGWALDTRRPPRPGTGSGGAPGGP